LSWEYLRVRRKLLCHAALDASVSDVKRICEAYRWDNKDNSESDVNKENDRALQQWDSRSLNWSELSNGSTLIQLALPPEIAQAFLNSVEHSMNQSDNKEGQLSNADYKMAQRRADAAVLMAETSLRFYFNLRGAGKAIATADRYQVIVSVDAADLPIAQSNAMSPNLWLQSFDTQKA